MTEQLKLKIESLIKSHKVFIFMKGVPDRPQCGFSMQSVNILKQAHPASAKDTAGEPEFGSYNILEDEEMREGIKEYTGWPTIPQIFINGEFVGGCDIITEMFESGELVKILS